MGVRKTYWEPGFWHRSYCVLTCGGAPLEVIKRYLKIKVRRSIGVDAKFITTPPKMRLGWSILSQREVNKNRLRNRRNLFSLKAGLVPSLPDIY